jgi:hypothetical protein
MVSKFLLLKGEYESGRQLVHFYTTLLAAALLHKQASLGSADDLFLV